MPVISYSQNFEDVLLARVFPSSTGTYIDVGAAHPVYHSVTKLFYDRGWSGVNLEPHEGFCNLITAARPRDVNLNVPASNRSGPIRFFEVPSNIGWATISEEQVRELTARGVDVVSREMTAVTLAQVCEQYISGEIAFLKIDVEGAERDVLLGADFTRWRPRVVVVEATEQGSRTPNHQSWERILLERDYLFAQFDGLNRYYVRSEDRDLLGEFQVPVCCFDDAVKFETVEKIERLERELAALKIFNATTRRQVEVLEKFLLEQYEARLPVIESV